LVLGQKPTWVYHSRTCLLVTSDFPALTRPSLLLDFSKAFDTVRHYSLMSKLGIFPIPDCFHNWIIDYFSSRQHQTKSGDQTSTFWS